MEQTKLEFDMKGVHMITTQPSGLTCKPKTGLELFLALMKPPQKCSKHLRYISKCLKDQGMN